VLGTQLGLPVGRLDSIEHDNYHKAEACCNAMLERWLDVDMTANWEKLFEALESPAVSSEQAIGMILLISVKVLHGLNAFSPPHAMLIKYNYKHLLQVYRS